VPPMITIFIFLAPFLKPRTPRCITKTNCKAPA